MMQDEFRSDPRLGVELHHVESREDPFWNALLASWLKFLSIQYLKQRGAKPLSGHEPQNH